MIKLHNLSIKWNYDDEAVLSMAHSTDKVLEAFFTMKDWEFIKRCFKDISEEKEVFYENKGLYFESDYVILCVDDEETRLQKHECLKTFSYLYDLMIHGAHDDHHSVRYETWWHEFIEAFYQLQCKIKIEEEFYKDKK